MRRDVLIMAFAFAFYWMHRAKRLRNTNRRWFSLLERIPTQIKNLSELVDVSDDDCKNVLRMDRLAFLRFCNVLVSDGGLKNSKHVSAKEKVAIFLFILAHHSKNRIAKFQFKRSGQTISKYFHGVLHCVLKLHSAFLVEPQPVPDDSSDPRWGKFKGCLGALDGTYIDVLVPTPDKGRYWNRKGHMSVNVLGVCDKDMKFVYVLTGWEGSATRWEILRSPSWYPIKVHKQIIMACCLIHNFIRSEMAVDPLENGLDEFLNTQQAEDEPPLVETIDTLEYSPEWNLWRDNIAQKMFTEWSVNMDAGMEAKKGKVTKGHRSWTMVEEDALIQCLVGIVNDGWMADNRFKAGFQRELEKGMRKLIPGTDILANPHINSKIHVWKKEFGNLSDLLGKSGIGWNSTTCTLDIIDETVWDAQKRFRQRERSVRWSTMR
ncbi:hypothetical protein ACS0TY_027371 [Phlomoides rotata]